MKRERITKVKVVDGQAYWVATDGSLRPLRDLTDWKRVNALTDDEIVAAVAADPDAAPIADEAWFASARRARPAKEHISIKLDADVLAFFRNGGAGYQTRINDVLRAFMEHETIPTRPRARAMGEAPSPAYKHQRKAKVSKS